VNRVVPTILQDGSHCFQRYHAENDEIHRAWDDTGVCGRSSDYKPRGSINCKHIEQGEKGLVYKTQISMMITRITRRTPPPIYMVHAPPLPPIPQESRQPGPVDGSRSERVAHLEVTYAGGLQVIRADCALPGAGSDER
jgi:hypothetical protein